MSKLDLYEIPKKEHFYKFAFISRHEPTKDQHNLAAEQYISLIPIGDLDAFTFVNGDVKKCGDFQGVIVVHPAMALKLRNAYPMIGVFENSNRDGIFKAEALHIY